MTEEERIGQQKKIDIQRSLNMRYLFDDYFDERKQVEMSLDIGNLDENKVKDTLNKLFSTFQLEPYIQAIGFDKRLEPKHDEVYTAFLFGIQNPSIRYSDVPFTSDQLFKKFDKEIIKETFLIIQDHMFYSQTRQLNDMFREIYFGGDVPESISYSEIFKKTFSD